MKKRDRKSCKEKKEAKNEEIEAIKTGSKKEIDDDEKKKEREAVNKVRERKLIE